MLVLAAVPATFLLAPRVPDGSPATAAGATGGPHSSMAGPTTFAAIGPTAIPASSVWDGNLAVPTPAPSSTDGSEPNATPKLAPGQAPPTKRPGKTASPTSLPANPTHGPTAPPTSDPTAAPTPTTGPTAGPTLGPTPGPTPGATPNPGPCTLFPRDNVWNRRVDSLPVRADSATLINSIGIDDYLHPDFSSTAWNGGIGYGIPYNLVTSSTPTSSVSFQYAGESDPGPYPIPANPKIEGGSDRHILLWNTSSCYLYELFNARKSGGAWLAGSGAIWNLRSNALRPDGWTSADAAGLPILPGLARWDEVSAGAILHALRFTAPHTRSAHIYPARHHAGEGSAASLPPMGLRVRLKASVDISGFGPQARVILTALKRYGMILADNGSPWYLTGAPHASWDDDQLHDFHQLTGADFEVVNTEGFN